MNKTTSFLIIFFLSTTLFAKSFIFKDFQKDGIEYVWDREDLFEQGLQIYLAAFRKLYTELNVANREKHFASTMKHELELAKKHPFEIRWLIAIKDGKPVGLSIIELFAFPSIYVREVAVLPEYQRQGIGRELTFAPLKDYPNLRKLCIVTRRINQGAIDFYKALGFKTTTYSHDDYDPKVYIGMEWENPKG